MSALESTAPWVEKRVIGDATLYLGDCLGILPHLGEFDAVVTDPPYGVSGGSGTLGRASKKTKYSGAFEDSREYLKRSAVPAFAEARSKAVRAIVTPGTPNCFLYPEPDDIGILWQPAATGLNKWGRETSQPVLFYGKDPMAGKTIQAKHFNNTRATEEKRHPCAKPVGVASWMVGRASLEGESVLDPFMGSGTTGVACANLGRSFTGIEIDPDYFEIACERIDAAYSQGKLF